jgi:acetyl-CoA carboxylase biotin carboxyl carrier protein
VTQKTVHAEMAGAIVSVACTVGSSVAAGQELLVMESMKMEIPILAETQGKIVEILVAEGDPVTQGQALVVVDT